MLTYSDGERDGLSDATSGQPYAAADAAQGGPYAAGYRAGWVQGKATVGAEHPYTLGFELGVLGIARSIMLDACQGMDRWDRRLMVNGYEDGDRIAQDLTF